MHSGSFTKLFVAATVATAAAACSTCSVHGCEYRGSTLAHWAPPTGTLAYFPARLKERVPLITVRSKNYSCTVLLRQAWVGRCQDF